MRKILVISLIIILFFNYSINAEFISEDSESFCINNLENINSIRNEIENVVIVSDSDPYFGIIGAYIACWYDKNDNISGLLPFLVQSNKKLTNSIR